MDALRSLVAVLPAILLAACGAGDLWLAVPPQHQPLSASPPAAATLMVDMSAADAADRIVSDIYPAQPGVSWRWTGARPAVRLMLARVDRLRFSIDFAIWDEGMRQTGPVTLRFFVNDHPLAERRYDTPGVKHFDEAVPAGWLTPLTPATAAVAIDKLYVSPRDGLRFGIILVRMGFVRAE